MRSIDLRLTLATLGVSLLIGACGGATPADSTSAPERTDVPAAVAAADEEAPVAADEQPPADAGPVITACELFDPQAIAAAFDIPAAEVGDGELELTPTVLSPGNSECEYGGEGWRLLIDLTPEDGANLYGAARGAYDDAVELDAGGDGAFWSPKTKRMFAWKGTATAMVTIQGSVDGQTAALKLARAFSHR